MKKQKIIKTKKISDKALEAFLMSKKGTISIEKALAQAKKRWSDK